MPRIIFNEDFIYKPLAQQTFEYKKGEVVLVTQEIADKAIKAGKAEATDLAAPHASIASTIRKFPKKKTQKVEDKVLEILSDPSLISTSED